MEIPAFTWGKKQLSQEWAESEMSKQLAHVQIHVESDWSTQEQVHTIERTSTQSLLKHNEYSRLQLKQLY